jgi:4-hydroxy-3-methylbut-2-enyl diphosphate reductase
MPRSEKAGGGGRGGGRGPVTVVVSRFAGYCYGVERALQIAEQAGAELEPPVYTLGPLIHNPAVVERLARRGIAAVDDPDAVEQGTVIVRTHGVPPELVARAEARGLEVIDATCPFVSIAHRKAEQLHEQGYVPLILGERDHPEVVGLTARAGQKAIVVEDPDRLDLRTVRGKRVGVVVQTTQSRENLSRLTARLAPIVRELLVFNTICDATEKRQQAARELAGTVDVVVVVGGRNSANTTRLANLCREIQPNTHHVESADEIELEWLEGAARVGVTAGASTPEDEIEAVVARIRGETGVA